MSARKWAIWSWDAAHTRWLAVGEGTEKEMRSALERRREAARTHLPSARFTITPKSSPPHHIPEDPA